MRTRTFQSRYFAARISTGIEARIEVMGELDLASAPTFEAAARDLDVSCRRRVVLDLGRLAFIDAAGLHAVLKLHEKCLSVSTPLTILPGPRHVQRVFELAGADEVLGTGAPGGAAVTLSNRDERRTNNDSR